MLENQHKMNKFLSEELEDRKSRKIMFNENVSHLNLIPIKKNDENVNIEQKEPSSKSSKKKKSKILVKKDEITKDLFDSKKTSKINISEFKERISIIKSKRQNNEDICESKLELDMNKEGVFDKYVWNF